MSAQELQQLVEKIVQRVLERVEADPELAKLAPDSASPKKESWARTCTSYRDGSPVINPEEPHLAPKQTQSSIADKKLITENDIRDLVKSGAKQLVVAKKTIVTPAARDAAKRNQIVITVTV